LTPRISARAYELYQERKGKDGSAVKDWTEAEREVRKISPLIIPIQTVSAMEEESEARGSYVFSLPLITSGQALQTTTTVQITR